MRAGGYSATRYETFAETGLVLCVRRQGAEVEDCGLVKESQWSAARTNFQLNLWK